MSLAHAVQPSFSMWPTTPIMFVVDERGNNLLDGCFQLVSSEPGCCAARLSNTRVWLVPIRESHPPAQVIRFFLEDKTIPPLSTSHHLLENRKELDCGCFSSPRSPISLKRLVESPCDRCGGDVCGCDCDANLRDMRHGRSKDKPTDRTSGSNGKSIRKVDTGQS